MLSPTLLVWLPVFLHQIPTLSTRELSVPYLHVPEVPCMSYVPLIQLCLVMLGFSVSPITTLSALKKKVAAYPNLCTRRLAQDLVQNRRFRSISYMTERHDSNERKTQSYYLSKQVRTLWIPCPFNCCFLGSSPSAT